MLNRRVLRSSGDLPRGLALAFICLTSPSLARAGILNEKAFAKPELYLPTSNVDARNVEKDLSRRAAWTRFYQTYGADTPVFVDPRAGTATNLIVTVPLIPGTGAGNHLVQPKARIDARTVAALVRDFIVLNREVIGVDVTQLGTPRAEQVSDALWQVSVPQVVGGVRVRGSRIAATLSHGNLVLVGAESWADVRIDTKLAISSDAALAAAFAYVGGRGCKDAPWKQPELEIVPIATARGYGHRLVWSFGFRRADELERWEVLVDAHDGEVLALQDTNAHDTKQVSGGVYPMASTGVCPSSDRCGTQQPDTPMPFADTGLPAPNDYTNDAGLFDFPPLGNVRTTLSGRYVRILDQCGASLASSEGGDLDLGGVNGEHDCDGLAARGTTAPARTTFSLMNRIIQTARGWLPNNEWLDSSVPVELNLSTGFCAGTFRTDGSILLMRDAARRCTNAAELAGIIHHEWGHGLDANDASRTLSNPTEGFADIAAHYQSQTSCLGYGHNIDLDLGCGRTSDGTGFNGNESQIQGLPNCDLDCSGPNDADVARHADPTPATPQNFACSHCLDQTPLPGPCGREQHCEGQLDVQATWDLAALDLQAPPFQLSRTDAFIVGAKLFFQGSSNVGMWHACDCAAETSGGCGATNAFMQWLAADDDNGNLVDGTPHLTALRAAFGRHGIACDAPAAGNSGCADGPTQAPTLLATAGGNRVDLSWSAVPGARSYRVMRTEGQAGCDQAKAVIAQTTGLTYADTGRANGQAYNYVVHAVAASDACFGPSSACIAAVPVQCAGTISLQRDVFACGEALQITLEDSDLAGTGTHAVHASSTGEVIAEEVLLTESPAGSGRFVGTLPLTTAPASSGDGSLSVAHGDDISVGYLDSSRCGTPDVAVSHAAHVDCAGPEVTGVRVTDLHGAHATIRWETDEPSRTLLTYGLTAPPGQAWPPSADLVTSHEVPLTGLQVCSRYYYSVGASDRFGHETVDDQAGNFYSFETLPETRPTLGAPGLPMTIPAANAPGGTLATIQVQDVDVVQDINVRTSIASLEAQDLELSLIGPDQTRVVLSNRHGSSQAPNYQGTVFDDDAADPIASGDAPFTGSFRPDQPLSAFNGKIAAGPWSLRIINDMFLPQYPATLQELQLELVYPPRACGPSIGLGSRSFFDACVGSSAGGGNGVIEPGETLQVSIQVTNGASHPVQAVSARLDSYTPGIFVTRARSSFPNLAPGATAAADAPFELYVDPSVACGTPFVLRLDGSSDAGGWAATFPMTVGGQLAVRNAYFNSTPRSIPDVSTARSFINVSDAWILTDVDVTLTINHGSPTDLDVFLVAPDGTRVELTTDNGGSFASGYTDTVFDDEADTAITAGSSPFTGRFRPESPLSALDGKQASGAWTLEVSDDHVSVVGTLVRWSLSFEHTVAPPCATCQVAEPPAEVPSLAWSGSGRDTLTWSPGARAATYELHRGAPAQLPALLDATVDSCARAAGSQPSSGPILTEDPPAGSFYWFLVRAANSFGLGPAGSASAGERFLNANGPCP